MAVGVHIGVEFLAAACEFEKGGLLRLVALLTLEAGDAPADGLGAVGGAAGHDFGVQALPASHRRLLKHG